MDWTGTGNNPLQVWRNRTIPVTTSHQTLRSSLRSQYEKPISAEGETALSIAGKSGVVLFGSAATMGASFLSNIILVRVLTKADYGLLTIAVTIAGAAAVLVSAGLNESVARYIGLFRAKEDHAGIWGVIRASLTWAAAGGILTTIAMFGLSKLFAEQMHVPGLTTTLFLIALTIPAQVGLLTFDAVLRGFGDAAAESVNP